MARPVLQPTTAIADFRAFYWLKRELVAFCRAYGLSTSGSKQELSARIDTFLATGDASTPAPRQAARPQAMPAVFSRQTVIEPGWRCSDALRAFFIHEIGPHFHFNQVMRSFIANEAGKTLEDAITAWQAARESREPTDIAPQFEYNRHMRAFFQANPGKTRQAAIAAWNAQKAQRKSIADADESAHTSSDEAG